MAGPGEIIGRGESRRTSADYSHLASRLRRHLDLILPHLRMPVAPIQRKPFQCTNRDRLVDLASSTLILARPIAHISTDRLERIPGPDQPVRIRKALLSDQSYVRLCGNMHRARGLARRGPVRSDLRDLRMFPEDLLAIEDTIAYGAPKGTYGLIPSLIHVLLESPHEFTDHPISVHHHRRTCLHYRRARQQVLDHIPPPRDAPGARDIDIHLRPDRGDPAQRVLDRPGTSMARVPARHRRPLLIDVDIDRGHPVEDRHAVRTEIRDALDHVQRRGEHRADLWDDRQ